MCTGVELALVAAMAGGTALQVVEGRNEAKRQQRAINEGADEEQRIQGKANDATKNFVAETYDPATRLANYETEAGDREKALGALLASQEASGDGSADAATTGAVSNTYTQARAGAAAKAAERARSSARLMARGGATGSLFGNEALAGGDYASDMLGFGVESRMNQTRTNAAARARQSDLALLGGLLQAGGTAALAGGAGRAPAKPPATGGL